MKFTSMILMAMLIGGCSTTSSNQSHALPESAISIDQLKAIRVTDRDCVNIDRTIGYVERQLQLRGVDSAHPERLNRSDAEYNATAKIVIWSLRIGCNNPNRYHT
jgi:hypothetical protein